MTKLVLVPISNPEVKTNYRISVVNQETSTIYWGGSTDSPRNPGTDSKFKKIFDKLEIGDVFVFSSKGRVEIAGQIKAKTVDSSLQTKIGWPTSNRNWDAIVVMDRISCQIGNINSILNFAGTPNSSTLVSEAKTVKFWEQYGHLFSVQNVVANQTFNPKPKLVKEPFVKEVWIYTEQQFSAYPEKINPLGLVRNEINQLDHKYSIAAAKVVGLPVEIVGSYHNLEILRNNSAKGAKCSITLTELLQKFPSYNAKKYIDAEERAIKENRMPWQ